MYICGIDVGIKNLSICVYDLRSQQVVYWHSGAIVDGAYHATQTVTYLWRWIERHSCYLDNAVQVIVERQMRCNMRIIESLLHYHCFNRCIVVSPKAVKQHYSLSMRNYRLNKQRAIQWACDWMSLHPEAFTPMCTETFRSSKKKDDYADSLLLVIFYLDTYSTPALCEDAANPVLV